MTRSASKEGDFIEVEERDAAIIMLPKKLVDANQAWFWSPEWQRGERQAESDIRAGHVSGPYRTTRELKKHLGP